MSVGERLVVALVRSITGLRGAVRVEVLTDRPEDRFKRGRKLYREGDEEPLTITSGQPEGPGWRLQFAELQDRTGAESLRDVYLEAVVGPDEVLPRGEYYWHELVDTTVRDVDGRELGLVKDVYRAGGAEVLVVRGGPHGELDIPIVRSVVRIFAPRRGEIVVDGEALGIRAGAPDLPSVEAGDETSPDEGSPDESSVAGTSDTSASAPER